MAPIITVPSLALRAIVARLRPFASRTLLTLGLLHPALAQVQTVDELVSRGTINVGVLADLPPYGMLDDKQQVEGYDVDVANLLGKYLGVKVNIVQLTGPNRIPFLLTNKVDVLVATFGITPARAKQVSFSIPYSMLQNKLWASKGLHVAGPADLKGKRVGVPRGSVQDLLLTDLLGSSARVVRFDDDASTYQAYLSGQVDAIGETDVTTNEIARRNPSLDIEGKFLLLAQPNGITVRPNQADLLRWIDTFVHYIRNDGELAAINEKWLHQPMPPLPY